MDSCRVLGFGLRSFQQLMPLVFAGVTMITLCFFGILSGIVLLAVYVDAILSIESDTWVLIETKNYLKQYFVTKDMGKPKYLSGIEVAYKKYVLLFQRKYMLNFLEKTHLLGYKLASILMESDLEF